MSHMPLRTTSSGDEMQRPRGQKSAASTDILSRRDLSDPHSVRSLRGLARLVDACHRCSAERNPLHHIYGGGKTDRPEFCFVLINPTYRNISAAPHYKGPRFPFIGVRQFWRVLHQAGFFSIQTLHKVEEKPWSLLTTAAVLKELQRQRVYVTNLVKCAQNHPRVPSRTALQEDLPLFAREMQLVRPKRIVAFGRLTSLALTGHELSLGRYYTEIKSGGAPRYLEYRASDRLAIPVLPSFFPVGRGNPRLAAEILRLARTPGSRFATTTSIGIAEAVSASTSRPTLGRTENGAVHAERATV